MIEGSRGFESFPSRNGLPAGRYEGISLCSRHDPQKEAERIVSKRDRTARAALFLGFGMGYQVEAYLKATRDIPLIVVEKEIALLQEVSRVRDLSVLEGSDRILFFTDPNPENLTPLLRELQVTRFDIIPHATLVPRYEEFYRGVKDVVNRWLDRREINMNTVTRFGRLWVRNLAANLPLLERGQALSRLKNRFSRIPALLVAAGPTLEDHLPHMKELAERALVIAVDTSCANLVKHGVKPDFLIVTDPQYWNTRHLDFCSPEDILVVSDTSVHPRTLRDFTGPLYLSRSP
ncbi:MAG: motility associated factor glycosyltransferase family protein, partial [Spirochaetales bacterium]|nr:motility associated factor glycosyltransferase family protein [Spirochaetales bacterium]